MKTLLRHYLTAIGLVWAAIATPAVATDNKPLERNAEIRYGVLDNGMTYYIWPNRNPKGEAVYRLWVKSGSLNEDDDQLGLAHFLEHMAFNGSQHFPADRMVRFLESKGAKFGKDLNAHTSFDETVYKLQLPSHDPAVVDSSLLIMADWAYGLSLDSTEVEKEKGVILSEWIARNNKGSNTNDALIEVLFEHSRYAERNTIGDTGIVRNATTDLLRRYYESWYRPELMAIAVVGDINPEQVEQSIHRLFDGWKPQGKTRRQTRYTIPAYKGRAVRLETSPGEKKIELQMIRRIPSSGPVQNEEQMRQYVLNKVTRDLVRRRLSACTFTDIGYSSASMGRSSVVRGGDLWISSVTLNKQHVKTGIHQFWARRIQIQRYGFSQKEIDNVCQDILFKARQAATDPTPRTSGQMMEELYNDFMRQMYCMDPKQELDYMEKLIPEVDSSAIRQYLDQMFDPRHEHWFLHGDTTLLQQIPDEKKLRKLNKALTSRLGQHFAVDGMGHQIPNSSQQHEMLAPEPSDHNHLIQSDSIASIGALYWQFDNGCDIYYRQCSSDKERFLLTGFREGGLYHLDSTLFKAGAMASALVPMSGAGNMDGEALKQYLSGRTASMKMLIDKNRTGVAGNARRNDVPLMFRLLYNKWMGARVDTMIYKRVLVEFQSKDSTRMQASTDQLKEAFEQLYGSVQGYHFILTGNLPADSVLALCNRWLGALPSGPKEYTLVHKATQPLQADSCVTEYSDKEKATVTITWENAICPDSTFSLFRHQLMGEILKGVVQSRLRQVLREEMGITYSIGVVASSGLHPVAMWRNGIVCSCLPENTDTVQSVVIRELRQMIASPDSFSSTLEDVKQNMLNQHALHLQQETWWTGYIRNMIYNNEPDWNLANSYHQLVEKVTPALVAGQLQSMLDSPCLTKVSTKKQ